MNILKNGPWNAHFPKCQQQQQQHQQPNMVRSSALHGYRTLPDGFENGFLLKNIKQLH